MINDIDTFASENILSFITGVRSMDTWDSFVEHLKEMGLEDCIAVIQNEFDKKLQVSENNPFKA